MLPSSGTCRQWKTKPNFWINNMFCVWLFRCFVVSLFRCFVVSSFAKVVDVNNLKVEGHFYNRIFFTKRLHIIAVKIDAGQRACRSYSKPRRSYKHRVFRKNQANKRWCRTYLGACIQIIKGSNCIWVFFLFKWSSVPRYISSSPWTFCLPLAFATFAYRCIWLRGQ